MPDSEVLILRTKKSVSFLVFFSLFSLALSTSSFSAVFFRPEVDSQIRGERFGGVVQIPQAANQDFQSTDGSAKMSGRLKNLVREKMQSDKGEVKPGAANEKIRVMLTVTGDMAALASVIEAEGGNVLLRKKNMLGVEMPAAALEKLITTAGEIEYARLPHRFSPMDTVSEGVSLTGADKFHEIGYLGSGVKIAVIDVGFKGLSAAMASGDIPQNVVSRDYTGRGLQTQYLHGTACTEIVHDMAPQASLYLLKIADELDMQNALDFCVANGIDIISYSLGSFGTGPGNGTGSVDEAFDEVRKKGILVVAAAGNEADGSHWKGVFYDSNGDDVHEFHSGNPEEPYNAVAAYPYQDDDGNPENNDLTVIMRWNDWPAATVDYDLYVYEYYYPYNLVGYSAWSQNGEGDPPLEGVVIDIPDNENYVHYYAVVVRKKSGEPAGVDVEISLGGTTQFVEYYFNRTYTAGSSISEPADARSVFAVGAIDYRKWSTGPQETFSSQGPTNAWAGVAAYTKPDISGPDGTSGKTYGAATFFGTSAATPHVAGAAALVLSMKPGLTPEQLQEYLQINAIDMGVPGKDNLYGWGRLFIEPEKAANRGLPWMLLLVK